MRSGAGRDQWENSTALALAPATQERSGRLARRLGASLNRAAMRDAITFDNLNRGRRWPRPR